MGRRRIFKEGETGQIKLSLPVKLKLELVGAQLSVKRGFKLAPGEVVEVALNALEAQSLAGEGTEVPQ